MHADLGTDGWTDAASKRTRSSAFAGRFDSSRFPHECFGDVNHWDRQSLVRVLK